MTLLRRITYLPLSSGRYHLARQPGLRLREQSDGARNRQADHVEVAAFDPWNPARGIALNGICSRLVERLAAGDILVDLGVVNHVESYLRDLHLAFDTLARDRSQPGENRMST